MPPVYVDLALGLAFAFFALSLLVSAVQEGLIRLLNVRSKFLWAFLKDQLEPGTTTQRLPDSVTQFVKLALSVIRKPGSPTRDPRPAYDPAPPPVNGETNDLVSVEALYERLRDVDRKAVFVGSRSHISNIPAARFSSAIIELATISEHAWVRRGNLAWTAVDESITAAESALLAQQSGSNHASEAFNTAIGSESDAREVAHEARDDVNRCALAALDAVEAANQHTGAAMVEADATTVAKSLEDATAKLREARAAAISLREAIAAAEQAAGATSVTAIVEKVDSWLLDAKLANRPMARPLLAAWAMTRQHANDATQEIGEFAAHIEAWFNAEMERITRMYRRYTRWVITFIALIVTLITGFDSLAYARDLLADSALRSAAASASTGEFREGELKALCATAKDVDQDGATAAQEAAAENAETPGASSANGGEDDAVPDSDFACVVGVLSNPSLTRILSDSLVTASTEKGVAFPNGQKFETWGKHLGGAWFGMLLTVVALLFGAPFWWDVLRRLTGVRKSGGTST